MKLEMCQCDTDAPPGHCMRESLPDMTDSLILIKFRLVLQHVSMRTFITRVCQIPSFILVIRSRNKILMI